MKYLESVAAALVFSAVFLVIAVIPVWLLWNWLMPVIFGLPTISLMQAVGVCALSYLLLK